MVKTGYPGGQAVDRSDSPVATLHCTSAEDPSCGNGRSVSVLCRMQLLIRYMLLINIICLFVCLFVLL